MENKELENIEIFKYQIILHKKLELLDYIKLFGNIKITLNICILLNSIKAFIYLSTLNCII